MQCLYKQMCEVLLLYLNVKLVAIFLGIYCATFFSVPLTKQIISIYLCQRFVENTDRHF